MILFISVNEKSSECYQNQTEAISQEEVFGVLEDNAKKWIEQGQPEKANEALEGLEITEGYIPVSLKSGQKHLGPSLDYFGNGQLKVFTQTFYQIIKNIVSIFTWSR